MFLRLFGRGGAAGTDAPDSKHKQNGIAGLGPQSELKGRDFAQTDRVHSQRVCGGAVRGAGGVGRQLLCALDPLYAGAAAGSLEPTGRRRARPDGRRTPLFHAGQREPRAARPRRSARGAAGPVRGGRGGEPSGQLPARDRRVEIPLRRRLGGGQLDQPAAEPHHAQPRPAGRRTARDGPPFARRRDGGLCGRLLGPVCGGHVGAQHLVPRQRQARRVRLLRFDLLGRRGSARRRAGRTVEIRRSAAGRRGRDDRILAVFPRGRAHRGGRERRA